MQNIFSDYPQASCKQGWEFNAAPDARSAFVTAETAGAITQSGTDWLLQVMEPEAPCSARLLYNGFSVLARKHPDRNHIYALVVAPGVLRGTVAGLPPPRLTAKTGIFQEEGLTLHKDEQFFTVLVQRNNEFCLVAEAASREQALAKAETAFEEDFESLIKRETARRQRVDSLFGPNPRHNPPVALAAESLMRRLRNGTGVLSGLWSEAEGFEEETFSLNELYPLVKAWLLIDPQTAVELMKTVLSLQQATGGFPAWIEPAGRCSASTMWPLLAQTCEMVLRSCPDPALLKQMLPVLRKYVPWALRRFDPHRDRIPAWQSEQEIFVPGSFERGKATPELTVMLINEIESFLRLCEESEDIETAAVSLQEEHTQLVQALTGTFWNPEARAFSNILKNGHLLNEPSFGSFLPLLWGGLDGGYKTTLLQNFEDTHSFPGQVDAGGWKQEQIDDTRHLPAIHQFMALEALRVADSNRALLMLFVRRSREAFAAWFERESITAARLTDHNLNTDEPAFALGPVTASFVLNIQQEFQRSARQTATGIQRLLSWAHHLRIGTGELRILAVFILASVFAHLFYNNPRSDDAAPHLAEAALNYEQGRYTQALEICRHYPHEPLSRLLQANLLMLAERPVDAEKLYRAALKQEIGSPSALFGLALSLQMSGRLEEAVRRYGDFIDIYALTHPEAAELADEFRALAREAFLKPPKWRRIYIMPMMNDLGL
jgi:tetratricopeptide (TPR) repeat protein